MSSHHKGLVVLVLVCAAVLGGAGALLGQDTGLPAPLQTLLDEIRRGCTIEQGERPMLELFRRCRECEGAVEGNVVEGLEKLLLREDCSQLHGEIALWLKGRGAVSGRAVDGLCRVATDPESDGDGRRYAVLALAELKDSPTAARCLLAKLDGSDPDNLHRVARSLGGFRVEVDPIVEALRDRLAEPATDDEAVRLYTDEDLRIALLESLATYGPRAAGAAAEVTRLLRSDPKTSRAAVATLGEIGRLRDLDALEAYTRCPGVEQEDADAAVAAQDRIRERAGWFEWWLFELSRRDVKVGLLTGLALFILSFLAKPTWDFLSKVFSRRR